MKVPKGSYVVKPGDSWESIAGSQLGNQRMFLKLMQANGGTLHPGDVIRLVKPEKNPFISNADAASLGYATSTQIQQAYKDNGTGGYKSDRLPLGGMSSEYNPDGSPGSGPVSVPLATPLAPVGYGNNAKPAPGTGLVAGQTLGAPAPSLSGQAAASEKPQQGPSPSAPARNPFQSPYQSNLGSLPTSGYTPEPSSPAAPASTGARPPINMAGRTVNPNPVSGTQAIHDAVFGQDKPPAGMVTPPVNPGTTTVKPQTYDPQTTSAALATFTSSNQVSSATYNIVKAKYVADGGDPAAFDKSFGAKLAPAFNPDTNLPTSASVPPESGGWNNPSGPGYTSPSGYFVPYARKKFNLQGVYDPATGRYHTHSGGGGNSGLSASNLTTGLVTWRYSG